MFKSETHEMENKDIGLSSTKQIFQALSVEDTTIGKANTIFALVIASLIDRIWVQIPLPPLTSCVALGRLLRMHKGNNTNFTE